MGKQTTIDDLAVMVQKGFLGIDKKFEKVNEQFDEVNSKIDKMQSDIGHLKLDVQYLKSEMAGLRIRTEKIEQILNQTNNYIANLEYEDLMGRVKYLEIKLGIESGK